MSTEFHVFTYKELNHEQAVVFEVNRCEDNTVEILDMYLVANSKMGELKTKINFQNVISSIIHTQGGNVDDSNVPEILDVFDNLIDKEHRQQLELEFEEKQTDIMHMSVDSLLMACDVVAGLDPKTYPEMIEKLKVNK